MGQYYKAIVLKKDWKEQQNPIQAALSPYNFDNGPKLMEHFYVHNSYVNAFMYLVHKLDTDRSCIPCVWYGEYSDIFGTDGLPLFEKMNTDTQKMEIKGGFDGYEQANKWMYNKICNHSDEYNAVLEMIDDYNLHNYKYIINHTKKEYVKVPLYVKNKLIIHPLPILLAYGNGKGEDDYNDEVCLNSDEPYLDKRKYETKHNAQFVGTWAYDTISVTNNEADAKGYTKIDLEVEEEN